MSTDRISNMLSALKNATMVKNSVVELPYTKETEAIAKIIKEKGFLTDVRKFKEKDGTRSFLGLEIAYDEDGNPTFTETRRVSKPGRRLYTGFSSIKPITGGIGVAVISTSKGIMSGEDARKKKLGGEILCEVY